MHINLVFLSTYAPNIPLSGHVEIQADAGMLKVQLSEETCAVIQDLAVAAYEAQLAKTIEELQTKSPAYVALAPPEDETYTEFEEVPIRATASDDEISF